MQSCLVDFSVDDERIDAAAFFDAVDGNFTNVLDTSRFHRDHKFVYLFVKERTTIHGGSRRIRARLFDDSKAKFLIRLRDPTQFHG